MRLILALLITITLAGCSNPIARPAIDEKINVDELAISHPQWPLPVQEVVVAWSVIEVNNEPYIALKYEDSLDFRKFLNDIERVLKEQIQMLCYYRKNLKEPICERTVTNGNDEDSK